MSDKSDNKAVILLTIDALNLKHLKIYGYHRNTAPNLEKYIKKGTIFYNATSNGPETPSAFSAIFTSILPFLNGGYSPLSSQKISFPQILKENGIFTYGIHSNPNLGEYYNYQRGFDIFLDGERYKLDLKTDKKMGLKQQFSFFLKKILNHKDLINKLMYKIPGINKFNDFLRRKLPIITEIILPYIPIAYNAPYILSKIESYLKNSSTSLFLWAHFMDLHSPYNPPSKNIIKFRNTDFTLSEREFLCKKLYSNPIKYKITSEVYRDYNILYDAQINFLDEYLGKLFGAIDKFLNKKCLIIITADHGESLLDNGLTGHQGSIHDELLRIPLFIIELDKNKKLQKVNTTVQSIDIPCTILDFFDIDIPESYQGRSLIPLIEGKPLEPIKYIISECYQKSGLLKRNNEEGYKLISIKKDEYKYIFDEEKDCEFLYNVIMDPSEKVNLINQNQLILKEFRRVKDRHIQSIQESSIEKLKILKAINKLNISKKFKN